MKKRVAAIALLAILAIFPALPAPAAEEMQGAGTTAPGGLSEAAALPGEAPGNGYPEGLVHIVVRGDTLWDLSARYLGSPWRWPELWERNRFLTNPHYIYPGIRVEVFPPPAREYRMEILAPEPPAAVAEAAVGPPPESAPAEPVEPAPPGERYAAVPELDAVRAGVFLPERPGGIGHILHGTDSRVAFSEFDKVFLSLEKEIPPGQLLGVYRVRGPVGPPCCSSVSGYVKVLVGILQAEDSEEGQAAAVVRKSFEDLSGADRIEEEIPGYAPIALKPGGEPLEAVVLAGRGENTEFATGHVVYLDKGSEAGVEVGNLFRIFDEREEATWSDSPAGTPASVEAARAVVVRTMPGSSSAYVLSATRSFPAGVTARRGEGPAEGPAGAR